jgi:phosphoglycolate phosphatase
MKSIIFDWSGVVRDTVTSQLWIVNRIFEKYGVTKISLEEFRENWEQPVVLFYQKYLPKDYVEAERVKMFRENSFDKDCPKSSAYADMAELVHKLKRDGIFLAIVSTDLKETLTVDIKEWVLENVFDKIVTDVDDKFAAVSEILKANNLNPRDTFFIGDSNHEIDVAKKTGINSIAVTWGFTSERKLRARSPDYIAHNPQELESIVLPK